MESNNKNLDANGDATVSFELLAQEITLSLYWLNKSSDANVTFASATAFEILEHKSSITIKMLSLSSPDPRKIKLSTRE